MAAPYPATAALILYSTVLLGSACSCLDSYNFAGSWPHLVPMKCLLIRAGDHWVGVQQLLSHQPLKQKLRVERLVSVLWSLPNALVALSSKCRDGHAFLSRGTLQELSLSCDVPVQTRDDSLTDWRALISVGPKAPVGPAMILLRTNISLTGK